MQTIVILTGAGISAESGLQTFRDAGGLWEGYRIEDVATPEAWHKDKKLVLDFYNQRRKSALEAQPNAAHYALKELEEKYKVIIITQNVDDLHERAGSSNVLHLHGELFKSRSTAVPRLVYPINGWELNLGDKCEMGSQLRPHIVWFGEAVPMMDKAIMETETADLFMVVGTSLQVYPAAGLIDYLRPEVPKYIIDPNLPSVRSQANLQLVNEKATTGVKKIVDKLLANH